MSEDQDSDPNPLRVSRRLSSRRIVADFVKSDNIASILPEKSTRKLASARSATIKEASLKRRDVDRDGSHEKKNKFKRRATTKLDRLYDQDDLDEGSNYNVDGNDDRDEEFVDVASDDDECGDVVRDDDNKAYVGHRQKRRRIKGLSASEGSWECPHCSKTFGSVLGLQYHTDKFVCRPTLRPDGGVNRKGRRKILTTDDDDHGAQSTKKYSKIRGKIKDRTCPQCRRVFTSVTGMQYHREKRVCEQSVSSSMSILYDTLTPGLCFVTPYGIVEVVNDDRAIPCYVSESTSQLVFATDLKKQMKLYHNAVAKRQARDQKHLLNVAVMSLARRKLLRQAHDAQSSTTDEVAAMGTCSKASKDVSSFVDAIRQAYLVCGDVPHLASSAPKRKELEDPSAPASSFPDRIVECKLLPDQRPRLVGYCDKDDPAAFHNLLLLDGLAKSYTNSNRIFIQRRLLTTSYSLDGERYYCPVCYQCFTSKPGYKYHVDMESCVKKAQIKSKAEQQQRDIVESRALQLVDQYRIVDIKSEVDVAMRPDVRGQQSQNLNDNHGIHNAQLNENTDQTADDANVIHPDAVLAQLESELYRALGQSIGPIYPDTWRALGYRKAPKSAMKQITRNEIITGVSTTNKNTGSRIGESTVNDASVSAKSALGAVSGLASTPKPILPSPTIIDIRPLAQEIDAGRYPSMKRFVNEDPDGRDTECAICKQVDPPSFGKSKGHHGDIDEKVLPCDFCRQVEHYTCAITKFTIKYPEPCDDFMCHNCIGVVSTRRTRAERRRLEKLISTNADSATLESFVLQQPGVNQEKQKEIVSLTNGIVRDREFECVAAQGRRLDELNILLRDAQARLSLAIDVEDINEHRLSLLGTLHSDGDHEIL